MVKYISVSSFSGMCGFFWGGDTPLLHGGSAGLSAVSLFGGGAGAGVL